MNKLKTFTTTLLLGLFSCNAFAEESPQPQSTQTPAQAVQIQSNVANPNQVNINTASAAEIQDKLVGIGAKKAQAIVDYRTKNGAYSSVEQLKEVSGIGNATLEKNRERIVLQ